MVIRLARPDDVPELARLLWLNASDEQRDLQTVEAFGVDLAAWWTEHFSYVALVGEIEGSLVGMAWVALVARVPRPGELDRFTGDLQSVFVMTGHRGQGLGTALVVAAAEHAERVGARRVTVHSGRRAVPIYERLGFGTSRLLLQRPADT